MFDLEQTRRILTAAQRLGYELKLHADEFVGLGGNCACGRTWGHIGRPSGENPRRRYRRLGGRPTPSLWALPGTPFGLGHHEYTPAQAILDAGGALALATDCNPGTCWCESMQMVIALACRYMGLTQAQALVASTLNAAHAIDRGDEVGSLEPGRLADMVLLDGPDYRQLGYQFGTNLVHYRH